MDTCSRDPCNIKTMGDQYWITKKEQDLLKLKAARRLVLREEFQKQITNPRNHGHGGHLFDHQFMRFQAMRVNQYDHFKPTAKNALYGILFVAPFLLFSAVLKWDRDSRDHQFRTGQVAYKDRRNRFL